MYRLNRRFLVLLLAAASAACGGAQLNQSKLADTQASVRAADQLGASEQPQAALHLQLARDELAQAERRAQEGHGDEAAMLLSRAQADSDLALQLTRTAQEQEKAREAWSKLQDVQKKQP